MFNMQLCVDKTLWLSYNHIIFFFSIEIFSLHLSIISLFCCLTQPNLSDTPTSSKLESSVAEMGCENKTSSPTKKSCVSPDLFVDTPVKKKSKVKAEEQGKSYSPPCQTAIASWYAISFGLNPSGLHQQN